VLILGENGTGKELAAKALHVNSPRKTKPFVALNCAALNENLLDDELFGHVPGSFTGGDKMRKGRFEFAHGGTLFLDEVGDMPLSLQAKLLRVLENGEVVRIGSNESIKVDVRVVAATNKNLDEEVETGRFRRDLYYRLRVGVIKLPPLRERREDIPLLIEHFLKDLGPKHSKHVKSVAEPVRLWMLSQSWPGNVRELRHLLESMLALDFDGVLGLDDLPPDEAAQAEEMATSNQIERGGVDPLLGKPLEEVEKYYMLQMLAICENNREEAAKRLGIGERTLYRKLKEWQKP
jgi:two-component system response regulator HydG